jgi:sulfopyruvate decarboxylase subunit beta
MPVTRRFELLKKLVPLLQDELVVSNIGFPSQELYLLGDSKRHFYMLGSMGMASGQPSMLADVLLPP